MPTPRLAAIAAGAILLHATAPFAHSQTCSGNPCYAPHGLPGCNVTACCQEVCLFDPDCCTVAWDSDCVLSAETACVPFGVCGLSTAGNCFAPHGSPACNDALCCEAVCGVDPFCCEQIWDATCAQLASSQCGGPGECGSAEGSCYQAHAGGGCEDAECCEIICGILPDCCAQGWDIVCASAANCYCAGACAVNCPSNSTQELETCGMKLNDLCYNPGSTVQGQLITPGLPMCAKLFVEQLPNLTIDADVDIFVAQLGAEGSGSITATLALTSKKLAWAVLIPAPPIGQCAPLGNAVIQVQSQNTLLGTDSLCIPAGKYWVVASAGTFPSIGETAPFSCDDGRYLVKISYTTGCAAACSNPTVSCFSAHATPGCGTPAGCCQAVCAVDIFCCQQAWDTVCVQSAAAICNAPVPANDACDDALPIEPGTSAYTTVGATTDGPPLPPACEEPVGLSFDNDIWFSYLASATGSVRVTTCGDTSYASRLAVYEGTECPRDLLLACNAVDPECATGTFSTLTFEAECGASYLIRVGGRLGSIGTGSLTIEELDTGGCPCPADLTGNGVVDGSDLAIVLGSWAGSGVGDLNDDGTINGADIAIILGSWGPC